MRDLSTKIKDDNREVVELTRIGGMLCKLAYFSNKET